MASNFLTHFISSDLCLHSTLLFYSHDHILHSLALSRTPELSNSTTNFPKSTKLCPPMPSFSEDLCLFLTHLFSSLESYLYFSGNLDLHHLKNFLGTKSKSTRSSFIPGKTQTPRTIQLTTPLSVLTLGYQTPRQAKTLQTINS